MFTRLTPKPVRAWTLIEMLVGVAILSLCGLALGSLTVFSLRSFASMANYAALDRDNREAMDSLTRELRQAKAVTSYVTNSQGNSLTVRGANDQFVTYSFNADAQQLVRSAGGASSVLLTNCQLLDFSLFQRNPSNANFGVFPIASGNWTQSVKVVQLTWRTARSLYSGVINSENIQTARIVIRKQQN